MAITVPILCRWYYYPYFMDEEIETQRGSLTCPKSHSPKAAGLGLKATQFSIRVPTLQSHCLFSAAYDISSLDI